VPMCVLHVAALLNECCREAVDARKLNGWLNLNEPLRAATHGWWSGWVLQVGCTVAHCSSHMLLRACAA
jgi:hypothetical protein